MHEHFSFLAKFGEKCAKHATLFLKARFARFVPKCGFQIVLFIVEKLLLELLNPLAQDGEA